MGMHMNDFKTSLKLKAVLAIVVLLCVAIPSFSQDKPKKKPVQVRIQQAGNLRKTPDNPDVAVVSGDVIFKQGSVYMYCDKALFNEKKNTIIAYNVSRKKVRIVQADTLDVTGDTITYFGDTKEAKFRGGITLVDKVSDLRMTTNTLDYNMDSKLASYYGGARIISSKNNNTLTSEEGHYHSGSKTLNFKNNVRLVNPEYTIECDTLSYNTLSEVSHFLGPTYIRSNNNLIYCENGWYDTRNETSRFYQNSYIVTDEQTLAGDSIFYTRSTGIGEAFSNVSIIDTVNNYLINGDYAIHREIEGNSLITGKALLTLVFETDSLFLHADTLQSAIDSSHKKLIHAYHHVRFFKSDMQGKCDSLVYAENDSLLKLFIDPVLWSDNNQLNGEYVELKSVDGVMDKLVIHNRAFVVSEADTFGFNQIKGKKITGYFEDDGLRKIEVKGNGQTVFYAAEEGEPPIGMNKSECTDILVFIKENEIQKITFIEEPQSVLYPMDRINPKDRILKDFSWQIDKRPKNREDIYRQE
jgi:lipopolysaccharide export system protein LptA